MGGFKSNLSQSFYAKNGSVPCLREHFFVTLFKPHIIQEVSATPVHYWYPFWEYDINCSFVILAIFASIQRTLPHICYTLVLQIYLLDQ